MTVARRVLPLAVALALAASFGAAPAGATAATPAPAITISGSETTGALVADLIWYYRHAVTHPPRFRLAEGGTAAGVADAFRGVSAIGLAARDRDPADPVGLTFTPVALSGVCLVANPRNAVAAITRAQFADIAAGTITTWDRLPGATATGPIALVGYPDGEGAQVVVESAFLGPQAPRLFPGMLRLQVAPAVRAAVLEAPGGLGWVDAAYADGLRRLTVDGVPCTKRTIADGTYPARRGLNFVTRGTPKGAVARFITWTRTSRRARAVVATRFVPPSAR